MQENNGPVVQTLGKLLEDNKKDTLLGEWGYMGRGVHFKGLSEGESCLGVLTKRRGENTSR